MKRPRLYRVFREMNPDGTPGKITERISAKNVYAQIREFVMESYDNPEQGLFGIHLAYSYRAVIRGMATHWACTQRELEAAYPECHQVYDLAVQDHYLEEALRFGNEAYELSEALATEKYESAIAKAAANYKEYNKDGTRRIIRCEKTDLRPE